MNIMRGRARSAFSHTTALIAGVVLTGFGTAIFAWTGPAQSPPSGNVSAPINVGTSDQVKDGGLSVNALAVFGNTILAGTNSYLNLGTTAGSAGYGVRDNSGTLEFKSSGGSWGSIPGLISSYFAIGGSNTVGQIKFADGTTQTTASMGGIGASQTWSNPARTVNTTYQNTTGKPIVVSFSIWGNNSVATTYYDVQVSVDGTSWVVVSRSATSNYDNFAGNISAVVPDNHYYKYYKTGSNTADSFNFAELR